MRRASAHLVITLSLYRKYADEEAFPDAPLVSVAISGEGDEWDFTFRNMPHFDVGIPGGNMSMMCAKSL